MLARLARIPHLLDEVRLAADPGEWRQAFELHPSFSTLREDWRKTLGAVARAMATMSHYEACAVRSSRQALAQRSTLIAKRSISVHQVKRSVRALREARLLITLEPGKAPVDGKSAGIVPLYLLTIPASLDDVLPLRSPKGRGAGRRARVERRGHRVRAALGLRQPQEAAADTECVEGTAPQNLGSTKGSTSPLPPTTTDRTKHNTKIAGRVRWATRLRLRRGRINKNSQSRYATRLLAREVGHHMVLARISLGQLAQILEPFAIAGWSAADVRHALEQRPDGTRHRYTDRVREPRAWARWRLSWWLTPSRIPVGSRWEQLAQASSRLRTDTPLARSKEAPLRLLVPLEPASDSGESMGGPLPAQPNAAYLKARADCRRRLRRC